MLNTDKGKIDVEMNACVKEYLHVRNTAYQCDNYAHYTLVGEKYTEDIEIIQINFTYGLSKKESAIVRKYYIQDEDKNMFVKNFVILEYNMDKIMEFWYSKDEKGIEKYKYLIMLDLGIRDLEILSKTDKVVEEYKMNVELINKDVRFREYISEEEDKRKCYNSDIFIAKEEGKKVQAIETAKKMLLNNESIDNIVRYTSLSLEEIKRLKGE